ncbi:hypothetical protein BGZ81_004947, partial [Podila clonocystis]
MSLYSPHPPVYSLHASIFNTTTHHNSGGSGDLNLESSFVITDAAAFTKFSSFMLNAEEFEWHLSGKLNVKALGHTVKDLNLDKKIVVR